MAPLNRFCVLWRHRNHRRIIIIIIVYVTCALVKSLLCQLKGSVKEPNILIYFFFPPITQSCSVFDVLFIGRRGVSDFSVLKYY